MEGGDGAAGHCHDEAQASQAHTGAVKDGNVVNLPRCCRRIGHDSAPLPAAEPKSLSCDELLAVEVD